MSHDLNSTEGRVSFTYFGDVPWHKLGRRLDRPATAAEAMEGANLDYTVVKKPLRAIIHGRQYAEVPNAFATVRSDTNQVLGVVGSRYEPVQNRDAFCFFDPLVDRDEALFHSAGALGRGERIWLLAKLPDYIKVGRKQDPVEQYLLLYNSHDGSSHIRVKLTPIRVVCNNTLSVALSGSEQEVRIKHTQSAQEKLQDAHKILGLTNQLYQELDHIFNRMSLRKVTDKQLLDYANQLIPDNPEAESNARTQNLRKKIIEIHDSKADAAIHRGTVFGAFNAVTELTDHYSNMEDMNKQLKSMWFGSGERLKKQAFQLAQAML